LEDIETIQLSKTNLVALVNRKTVLLSTIGKSETDSEGTVKDLEKVMKDIINIKKLEIDTKDDFIRGWVLAVSKWLAFTWPYFAITLLGLKIACTKYFSTTQECTG
jgi:hypothetical protein